MIEPAFDSRYRRNLVNVPETIGKASGIRIFGQLLKSFLFSTDVALIRNSNANAIIAVYPFTAQPAISHALISAADKPILCGVGGGITGGSRVVELAQHAEFQGAIGVVLNKPVPNDIIEQVKKRIDIPVTVTVVSEREDFRGRINAGTDIFNVSGAERTPEIVRVIREISSEVAIIATGGKTDVNIGETIAAGANAISYTPPTSAELFRKIMEGYRNTIR